MKLTDKFIQQEIDNGDTITITQKGSDSKKVVVFSDWHLGTGGNNDNSLKNCLYKLMKTATSLGWQMQVKT